MDWKENLLNIDELSAKLGISRWTAYRYVTDQKIPVIRLGRHLRFHWPTVERWLLREKSFPKGNLISRISKTQVDGK